MPLLDVSDVLSDPLFTDTLTLVRRSETVGDDGRTVVRETATSIFGVVTSASGDALERLPEADRLTASITVHTKARLVSRETSLAPDDLIHAGRRYVVAIVNDYSRYGAGFVSALCVGKSLTP